MKLLFLSCLKSQSLKHSIPNRYFNSYSHGTFARTADIATETIVLDKGPLKDFPSALESRLRSLGLYTRLKNGLIELEKDHVVCEEGKELTSESAQLLVSFSLRSTRTCIRFRKFISPFYAGTDGNRNG